MKVRVKYSAGGISVDEIFTGESPDALVAVMKNRAASEGGFAVRLMINAMSPLGFAQEVVRRYSRQTGRTLAVPSSCAEFLSTAESEGIVTFLD